MSRRHATVWIDHKEAKVFHLDGEGIVDASVLHAPHHHVRPHDAVTAERSHPADAEHFYHAVAMALERAAEILVVGPATAKLELIKPLHKHHHAVANKVIGVETVDHPTDGQLLKYARGYFRASDRMH